MERERKNYITTTHYCTEEIEREKCLQPSVQ